MGTSIVVLFIYFPSLIAPPENPLIFFSWKSLTSAHTTVSSFKMET